MAMYFPPVTGCSLSCSINSQLNLSSKVSLCLKGPYVATFDLLWIRCESAVLLTRSPWESQFESVWVECCVREISLPAGVSTVSWAWLSWSTSLRAIRAGEFTCASRRVHNAGLCCCFPSPQRGLLLSNELGLYFWPIRHPSPKSLLCAGSVWPGVAEVAAESCAWISYWQALLSCCLRTRMVLCMSSTFQLNDEIIQLCRKALTTTKIRLDIWWNKYSCM